MDVTQPLPLLGGITPQVFMREYWQKKPLLVRQAMSGFKPLLSRSELFDLAANEDVQSRLVVQRPGHSPSWSMAQGPFKRKAFPTLSQPGWTLLVQGVDLHHDGVHSLMNQFRFVPDARLDDLMISFATQDGGVGPHFDSYDVFLLQAHGCRRWRIGKQRDLSLQPDMPLKILAHFEPEEEFLLEAGDMLYLPPRYAHDGIAQGECMTYSVGFRNPNRLELARELLERLSEEAQDHVGVDLYSDADQPATSQPAFIPPAMLAFAEAALQDALNNKKSFARCLGEYMTEPKPSVWFESGDSETLTFTSLSHAGVVLDRRTKMMFDDTHVFINGESFNASGKDAQTMQTLANDRRLSDQAFASLSKQAKQLLLSWAEAGWLGPIQ